MKKFLSLVLALAMILSMSVSVFASADPNEGNLEFEGTATVKIPAIKVSVPKTATLFINPMGFEVAIATGDATVGGEEAYQKTSNQIVSPVNIIKNSSPMKLSVGVIGTVTLADTNTGGLSLVTTLPFAAEDTKNSVFIYANFGTPIGENGQETLPEVEYVTPAENATVFPQLALTNRAPTKPVPVGEINKAGDDPTKFAFQFLGMCNANAKNDWTAGDKVTVKLAFTFKPVTA